MNVLRQFCVVLAISVCAATRLSGALTTVNWPTGTSGATFIGGNASTTYIIASTGVVNGVNFQISGGSTTVSVTPFTWSSSQGSNGVNGISGPGVVNQQLQISSTPTTALTLSFSFFNGSPGPVSIVNPILFVEGLSLTAGASYTFTFPTSITLLDSSPTSNVNVSGNTLTYSGGPLAASPNNGFAVQMNTTITNSTALAINVTLPANATFGFTLGQNATGTPEPNGAFCFVAIVALTLARRRRRC